MNNLFLTDKQVAFLANVSVSYISALFKKGDKFTLKPGEVDLRKCNPLSIAGGRRWNPVKVAEILGATPDKILEMLQ